MRLIPLSKATLTAAVDLLGEKDAVRLLGKLLSAQEVAELWSVPLSEVRRLTSRRELPCIRLGRRRVRYRLLDLLGIISAYGRPMHDRPKKNFVDTTARAGVQGVTSEE